MRTELYVVLLASFAAMVFAVSLRGQFVARFGWNGTLFIGAYIALMAICSAVFGRNEVRSKRADRR